jgi:hypothetical protein
VVFLPSGRTPASFLLELDAPMSIFMVKIQRCSGAPVKNCSKRGHANVWLYLRFCLSLRDVEELLAERGLELSYETVRRWVAKFGSGSV